ncbi:MAG: helix-turn-helix transcriptional regulator [Candidatus Thorarchaeota archaeon]
MEELSKLLFELSNEDRLSILRILSGKPTKLTKISSELDLTVQETSRHLSRMSKAGLIRKGSDGAYSTTPYGFQLLGALPSFSFFIGNKDYFMTHTVTSLPKKFISRIGELEHAEYVENAVVLFQHVDSLISRAKKYVWIMSDQALSSTFSLLEESLERGVEFKVILPADIEVPSIPEDMLPDFSKFRGTLMQPRHLGKVKHVVILSDSEAILSFPDLDGRLDYIGFRLDDDIGHQLCKDMFLYYWEDAVPV